MAENTLLQFESKKHLNAEQFEVGARLEAAEAPIKKVVSVSAFPKIKTSERIEGYLTFVGNTGYLVVYESEQGELKSIVADAEWSGKIKADAEKASLSVAALESTVTGSSPSELTISTLLSVQVCAVACEQVSAVEGLGEEYVLREKTHDYQTVVNYLSGAINEVYEEEVGVRVDQILATNAVIEVQSAVAGIDTVTLEGKIHLLAYLGSKEGTTKVLKDIDFKQEIACLSATPTNSVDVDVHIASVRATASVSDIDNKSNLVFAIEAAYDAAVLARASVSVIEDAFCLDKELLASRECVLCEVFEGMNTSSFGAVGISQTLSDAKSLCYVTNIKAEITDISKEGEGSLISGWAQAEVVYEAASGDKLSSLCSIPFSSSFEGKGGEHLSACARLVDARLLSDTEVELRFEIITTEKVITSEFISFLSSVADGEEKVSSDAAIRVHIVKDGEDLYSVAKLMNIRPDEIAAQNPNALEGLVGGDRLVVYAHLKAEF